MDLFGAKTEDGLVLQTFNLPEDFSIAAQFYIGLQHEKALLEREIKLVNIIKDSVLFEYQSQCLKYLNNLNPSLIESHEGTLVWPVGQLYSDFKINPLDSVASIVASLSNGQRDKEIKLIKQQISYLTAIINFKPQTIAKVLAILSNDGTSSGEQLERIMACARVSRVGAKAICNLPLSVLLNADNWIGRRIKLLENLLAYLEFLKSLSITMKLPKVNEYRTAGFIGKDVSNLT